MPDRQEVMEAILAERDYQDAKWGPVQDLDHELATWWVLIQEEMYEAWTAMIIEQDAEKARLELVQVAATAFSALQHQGVAYRQPKRVVQVKCLECGGTGRVFGRDGKGVLVDHTKCGGRGWNWKEVLPDMEEDDE